MSRNIKLLIQVIFFGSIWGILEATVGHVLHFIPTTIAGAVMFPIASLILYKAYLKTDSKAAMFYVAVVAAMIKSVDFLLPSLSIYKTINPMISILLESLVVIAVVSLLVSRKPATKYIALPIASVGWRLLFISWMGIQYITTGNLARYIMTFSAAVEFVVISGVMSGFFASVLLYFESKFTFTISRVDSRPIFASILLITALITTYTL
jgi:hypothetical protein